MSKENKNEEKVIDMTNENENNEAYTSNELNELRQSNELNELRESNANLIAEREQLQDRIASLEEKLKTEQEDRRSIYGWYIREKDKVRALSIIVKAMKSDFVTIDAIVDRIAKSE